MHNLCMCESYNFAFTESVLFYLMHIFLSSEPLCGTTGPELDIVFVMDDSAFLNSAQFDDQMTFFKDLASGIAVGENDANIALVSAKGNSEPGNITFPFSAFMTTRDVVQGLDAVTYSGVRSLYHTQFGLRTAFDFLMSRKRKASLGIIVTVTADTFIYYTRPIEGNTVKEAMSAGVFLMGIGLNLKDIDPIVNDPLFGFEVDDSGDIPKLAPRILSIICKYMFAHTIHVIISEIFIQPGKVGYCAS